MERRERAYSVLSLLPVWYDEYMMGLRQLLSVVVVWTTLDLLQPLSILQ